MRGLLPALLLLCACGGGGDGDGENNGEVSADQIERVSTPQANVEDAEVSAQLEPLTRADLEGEGLLGAGCSFTSDGLVLLASVGSDSLARVEGELRHLVQSAPVGPTGGFFEDGQLSISVGRTNEAAAPAGETRGWPARLTVTNRRREVQQEIAGTWTCGA